MTVEYLVQDDTQAVTFDNFLDESGVAIATNMVSAVVFTLRNVQTGETPVNAAVCTITSTGSAPLVCTWTPTSVSPGLYDAELRLTYTSGRTKRFPERAGDWQFLVRAKLA